jgi:hypothetical protein
VQRIIPPPKAWHDHVAVARRLVSANLHVMHPACRRIVHEWFQHFQCGAALAVVALPVSDVDALQGGWRPQDVADFEKVRQRCRPCVAGCAFPVSPLL